MRKKNGSSCSSAAKKAVKAHEKQMHKAGGPVRVKTRGTGVAIRGNKHNKSA